MSKQKSWNYSQKHLAMEKEVKKKKKENERQKKLAKVQLKLMNGPNDKEKAAKSHKRKHQERR